MRRRTRGERCGQSPAPCACGALALVLIKGRFHAALGSQRSIGEAARFGGGGEADLCFPRCPGGDPDPACFPRGRPSRAFSLFSRRSSFQPLRAPAPSGEASRRASRRAGSAAARRIGCSPRSPPRPPFRSPFADLAPRPSRLPCRPRVCESSYDVDDSRRRARRSRGGGRRRGPAERLRLRELREL